MPNVAVRIPQIGEGLQEARLVAVLKQPGDTVKRDEPLYQMETDKAVMDVESPYDGILVSWEANEDDVLPIGAVVARMEVADGVAEMSVHGAPASTEKAVEKKEPASPSAGARDTVDLLRSGAIPPRTRAYAKQKGLSDDQLAQVSFSGSKMMPEDIDAFLAGGASAGAGAQPTKAEGRYKEEALSTKQRILASRLQRGAQLVVPGTMLMPVLWEPIEAERARVKAEGGDFQPSAFTMFAYAVAKATREMPVFRSSLVGEGTLRTYDTLTLGIAVSLPGDDLVIAAVEEADVLSWREFAERARERIAYARQGNDQASEAVTLSLTNMGAYGIQSGTPVVVPPGVATLFVGEAYYAQDPHSAEPSIRKYVNIGLTIDHRLINGVGGALLMNAVKKNVENISELVR